MLTLRESLIITGTIVGVLLYQNGARMYAKWWANRKRRFNKLVPAQIATTDGHDDLTDDVPRRIRKAETVLLRRSSRIILVVESSVDTFNQQAVLRTAENMGIQHVWIVEPAFYKEHKPERRIARGADEWLTIRRFVTTEECIQELLRHGYTIWATDLGQTAVSLEDPGLQLPERLAIVMGREADGVSQVMLEAAHKRVYLPIHGFADSLNLNVATGMVLQRLFYICPEARGQMFENERETLREEWYRRLVKGNEKAEDFLTNIPKPFIDLRRPDDHRGAWMGGKVRRRIQAKETRLKEEFKTKAKSLNTSN